MTIEFNALTAFLFGFVVSGASGFVILAFVLYRIGVAAHEKIQRIYAGNEK